MNTIEELIKYNGISEKNAERMLRSYAEKIGTRNGDYEITDITYVGSETKRVEETCVYCGDVYYKDMINRRNKWSELKAICKCQRDKQKIEREENRKSEKIREKYSVLQNEIGKIYGEFTIIGLNKGKYTIKCNICGTEKEIDAEPVISGQRKDYKCHTHRKTVEKYDESYIGRKNNMLTVTGITWDEASGKKLFKCLCDCGNTYYAKPTLWEIGKVKSCGCYLENRSADAIPTERIKSIYRGMKLRCLDKDSKDYHNYGGRGIKICSEWLDFNNFLKWSMENGYDNKKTIDRIDFNGDYKPDNCRWTDWHTQCANKRPRMRVRA